MNSRILTCFFAFFLTFLPGSLNAQKFVTVDENISEHLRNPENGNRNSEGKVVRGSYLTNEWYDNWIFGIAGGIQTLVGGGNKGLRITPEVEFNITKWVTPSIAARLGLQGWSLEENNTTPSNKNAYNHYELKNIDGVNYFYQTYVHGDLLWSITNAFLGYKETRFYNCNPYFHAGYYRLSHPDHNFFTDTYRDREIAFGLGLYNTFRVTAHLGITADLRWTVLSDRYHNVQEGGPVHNLTANVGLSYTIHKWYWSRYNTAVTPIKESLSSANDALVKADAAQKVLQDRNDALAKELADKNAELAAKQAELDASKNQPVQQSVIQDELINRIADADLVIYYEIDKDKILSTEAVRIDQYVRQILSNNPKHVFYLTGSADKGTGNFKINTRLSHSRPEGVKKLLMRKYGVPESQIVLKAAIISDKHEDGRLDRCVIFESK